MVNYSADAIRCKIRHPPKIRPSASFDAKMNIRPGLIFGETRSETQNELETSGNISNEERKLPKPNISYCPETVAPCTPVPMTLVPVVLKNVKGSNDTTHDEDFHVAVKLQRRYKWDFSKICFPNCANDQPPAQLPDPEPAFLPDNVIGRQVDVTPWLGKLNLHREKFSRREQEQLDWERKYKTSINADPKIKKCRNWSEYKNLLRERESQGPRERPAHLWSSTGWPLLSSGPVKPTASVLEQVTVMNQSTLLEDSKRITDMRNMPEIHFNLYQADGNTEFKKSKPGKPYAYLCVRSFDEQIPSLRAVKSLAFQGRDIPVVFALVDCGEIAFYTFKDFQLPVDVYP